MNSAKTIKDFLANQRYWDVFVIDELETVVHACELMEKNRVGSLIVVDSKKSQEDSHVVGIITERDVVKAISSVTFTEGIVLTPASSATSFATVLLPSLLSISLLGPINKILFLKNYSIDKII